MDRLFSSRAFATAVCGMACIVLHAADIAVRPVRVCDVMRRPTEYQGKTLMVLGRLSSRSGGRFLSEDRCEARPSDTVTVPVTFELRADSHGGPMPPSSIDIDRAAVDRQLDVMKDLTALKKFRLGSTDYDCWALVYARVEIPAASGHPAETKKTDAQAVAGTLVYRSDSFVIFLNDQ